jgi:lipoyl(octanoyl) transferase
MRWTLLRDSARPGWENMAMDSAMLDLAAGEGSCILRLYRWEPFCLSFGRHEPATRRYDRARIESLGLDCVRRPTGGRAVWHARELTYSVAAPVVFFGGMREAYAAIHRVLAEALASLGAHPSLALSSPGARAPSPGAGPCFSAPVGGEVLLDGRKVLGSAQLRQGDALLQHGSLLLEDDQSLPRSLAGLPQADPAELPLRGVLNGKANFETVSAAIVASATARWGSATPPASLLAALNAGVRAHAERFQDPGWTWQR